jgi:pimeloyl-ACP methyl ester carboxylesterase
MPRRHGKFIAGAMVLALAGCTSGRPAPTATLASGPSPTSNPSASAAPVTGALNPSAWVPCPAQGTEVLGHPVAGYELDCASIAVPQDWNHSGDGKTFTLSLVRARSSHQSNRIGSLLVNPGGPGGSGVQLAVALTQQLPDEITQRFDIVGFDPRGVGASTEVKCLDPATEDQAFAAVPDPVSQADFDSVVALTKTLVAPCGAKYGAELPLFSTEQAARDMDAIRIAVGDSKLTYLGFSYGTLLGAVYAQLFPTHIREMVLDGAEDPKQGPVAGAFSQAGGFELAFNDFSAWCKANAGQCPLPDEAHKYLAFLLNLETGAPVTGADGRKATPGWVMTAVTASLYTQRYWPVLARALVNLQNGDPTLMFELADSYAERDASGHYTNLFDANEAVNCTDYRDYPTVAQIRQYQSQWRAKYPLFGGPIAMGLVSCAPGIWPGTPDPFPTGPAKGAPPIVVVGTTGDPATPYENTANLANMLGVGHVLTWEGEGHTAYPSTPCIVQAVDSYLIDLQVPQEGLRCPAK